MHWIGRKGKGQPRQIPARFHLARPGQANGCELEISVGANYRLYLPNTEMLRKLSQPEGSSRDFVAFCRDFFGCSPSKIDRLIHAKCFLASARPTTM